MEILPVSYSLQVHNLGAWFNSYPCCILG